jgi:hypothetical protein
MKRVAQAQAQQASLLPRAIANEPRVEIIDLVSDDDKDEEEVPAQPQDLALGPGQAEPQLGIFADLLDPELLRVTPPAHVPARQPSPPHVRYQALPECFQIVTDVFPGICFGHVSELYNKIAKSPEYLVAHVLDQVDSGILYPKAKRKPRR